MSQEIVILAGARTGNAKFQGSLGGFTAPQIGAAVLPEALKRAGVSA